jgi:hypothetical protein
VSANALGSVSCRSTRCVVVDNGVGSVTATNPTGGAAAWKVAQLVDSTILSGVSCPSISFCVAVAYGGSVATSGKPAGGPATWSVNHANGSNFLTSVSCPTISLCVAVDQNGSVVIGTRSA